MPAAARKPKEPAADTPPENTILPGEELLPDDVQVMQLLDELADTGVTVKVYRQGDGGARDLTLIDEMPLELFQPIKLASPPFNGGTFRIHARSAGGLVANRELKVQKREVPEVVKESVSKADIALMIAEALRSVLPSLVPQAPPGPSRKEILEEMTLMAAMFKPGTAPPAATINDQIGTLSAVLALAKQLNPAARVKDDEGKTDVMGTLLEKGLDMMGGMVEAGRASRAPVAALPVPTALPAPVAVAVAEPEPEPESEDDIEMRLLAKIALKRAVRAAAAGESAEEFAEDNYDDVPDNVLEEMLNNPAWFQVLCEVVPECAPHEAWFLQVRDFFAKWYAEENAPLTPGQEQAHTAATSTNGDKPLQDAVGTDTPAGPVATGTPVQP